MAGKKRLSEDEAREYSATLGKSATANYELMDFAINTLQVPQSLGMDAAQWVESIGGYVRLGVEKRQEAVASLLDTGKKKTEIAEILGISTETVSRDAAVIEAKSTTRVGPMAEIEAKSTTRAVLTTEQKTAAIRKLIDEGKKDAEIAVAFDMSPGTIQNHYRRQYKLEQARTKKDAAMQKEAKSGHLVSDDEVAAMTDDMATDMKKTLSVGVPVSLPLDQALAKIKAVTMSENTISDFDTVIEIWAEIGNELWVYGAKRGLDVSHIASVIERMGGGE